MARKRTRRNPATTGAVVVNPRRKRKNARKARRRNPLAIRTNSRRRRATKRRNALAVKTNRRKVTRRRRSNPLAVRTNSRRRKSARRANPRMHKRRINRSHKRRANPRRRSRRNALAVQTNRRRRVSRKSNRRRVSRRNPSIVSSVKGMFSKVPVLGGFLGTAIGFALPAFFGAVGVIPTAFVAKKLAPYMPFIDSRLFYVLSALGLAALVQKFAPLDAKLKRDLALGIATGGAAVALYKHATGSGGTLSGEYGLLEYGGLLGDEGYAVIPGYAGFGDLGDDDFGDYGDDDFGAYQVIPGYGEAL